MASSATQNASRRESHSYSSSSRSVGRRRASASLLSAFSLPSRSFSKARQQANACFTFPNILGRRRRSDTVVVAAGGERGSADSLFDMPGFSDLSEMDRQMERLQLDLEAQMLKSREREGGAGRTYRRENATEEKLQGGGFRKSYYSESVTVYGGGGGGDLSSLQPYNSSSASSIALPALFWIATVTYVAGLAAFYAAFDKTSFKTENRVAFALLWPFLFMFNDKYRNEFKTAVQNKRISRSQQGEEEES